MLKNRYIFLSPCFPPWEWANRLQKRRTVSTAATLNGIDDYGLLSYAVTPIAAQRDPPMVSKLAYKSP